MPKPGYKLIFDLDQAKGRDVSTEDIRQVRDNWGKRPVGVTLGHLTDYDTKAPVGAWLKNIEVSPDLKKIYGLIEPLEPITAPIPEEFRDEFAIVQDFGKFFREAVQKDYYRNFSIGMAQDTPQEGWYLEHLAVLGAVPAQCPNLDVLEMARQQGVTQALTMEFSKVAQRKELAMAKVTDRTKLQASLSRVKEFAQQRSKISLGRKLMQFARLDPATMEDRDWEALNSLIEACIECYGLPADATIEAILGAVQAEAAEEEEELEANATIGELAQEPLPVILFGKDNKGKRAKNIIPHLAPGQQVDVNGLIKQVLDFAKEVKNFDGAAAPAVPDPNAPAVPDPNAAKPAVEILTLTPEQVQTAVTNFVNAAKQNGTWVPAFDEAQNGMNFTDILSALAQVKMGSGSGLDALALFWGTLPKIAEFAAIDPVQIKIVQEFRKQERPSFEQPTTIPNSGGPVINVDKVKLVKDFQKEHNIASFVEADARMRTMGLLDDNAATVIK